MFGKRISERRTRKIETAAGAVSMLHLPLEPIFDRRALGLMADAAVRQGFRRWYPVFLFLRQK
jgi:hypothetical protein